MNVRRSLTLNERVDAHDRKVQWTSVIAALAMVLAGLVAIGTTPASATGLQLTDLSGLQVVAARTVGTGAGAINGGDPIAKYSFLLQQLNVGDPNDAITNCLPPSNNGTYLDPAGPTGTSFNAPVGKPEKGYPNNCQWPGTRESNATDPIVASGTQDDVAAVKALEPGHYLISIRAEGYEVGGAHFDVPRDNAAITAALQPGPLPLATVRIRVFEDTVPVDGTYEIGAEAGLSGFRGYLSDMLGDVSTDFFGNPLCTVYLKNAPDATHPDGTLQYDGSGAPIIDPVNNLGQGCLSNADGDVVIPNMAPGRYGITIRPPADKKDWFQTTTL
jgi:hypothetical protein